jgi:hypothetical protein
LISFVTFAISAGSVGSPIGGEFTKLYHKMLYYARSIVR